MIGRILFWIIWPGLWLYMPLTRRVRVVVVRDEKVLLVKHWLSPQQWDLPGGGIQFKESVATAAARELKEELSICITDVVDMHNELIMSRKFGILYRLHFVRATIESSQKIVTDWEIKEVQWRPVSELTDILPPTIR